MSPTPSCEIHISVVFRFMRSGTLLYQQLYTGMDKLVCTPASTALFACPRPGGNVSRLYRHIRQAAIPARVVLGTAVF